MPQATIRKNTKLTKYNNSNGIITSLFRLLKIWDKRQHQHLTQHCNRDTALELDEFSFDENSKAEQKPKKNVPRQAPFLINAYIIIDRLLKRNLMIEAYVK